MALPKRFTLQGKILTIHNRSTIGMVVAEDNNVLLSVDRDGQEAFFISEEETVLKWIAEATDIEYE